MINVNCLNNIAACGLKLFSDEYNTESSFEDAQAVLVRSAKMHDMELSDNLLAIARAGAGVNNIPLDKCAEEGIVVFNTPGANANAVKEQVIAAMLLASRDLIGGNKWVADNAEDPDIAKATEKAKKAFAGQEIKGKKLGVIGLGAIGQLVANAAIALGMEVYGCPLESSLNHVSAYDCFCCRLDILCQTFFTIEGLLIVIIDTILLIVLSIRSGLAVVLVDEHFKRILLMRLSACFIQYRVFYGCIYIEIVIIPENLCIGRSLGVFVDRKRDVYRIVPCGIFLSVNRNCSVRDLLDARLHGCHCIILAA